MMVITAWRQNVVDTTVAEINKIPAAMSQNTELVPCSWFR